MQGDDRENDHGFDSSGSIQCSIRSEMIRASKNSHQPAAGCGQITRRRLLGFLLP
jgi:hypothetical protein